MRIMLQIHMLLSKGKVLFETNLCILNNMPFLLSDDPAECNIPCVSRKSSWKKKIKIKNYLSIKPKPILCLQHIDNMLH